MEPLPRTAITLDDCRRHIEAVHNLEGIDTAAIEAYLARHVVLVLCAEIEQSITELVYERVDRGGCDEVVANLMRARKKGMVRSATHDEIGQTLGQLGVKIRDQYRAAVEASIGELGVSRLGNAVGARDAVSHSVPPSITLGDVRHAYEAALHVVVAARDALSTS